MMDTLVEKLPSPVTMLQDSYSHAEQAVAGLDENYCSRCPAPDSWSITGVLEHLVVMEGRVQLMLKSRLFTEGVPTERQPSEEENARLVASIASRANRVSAPSAVYPSGRYHTSREALAALEAVRRDTIAYVQNPAGDLKAFSFPHPIFGPLSGYQWVLAIAAHTDRHVAQIEEIKAAVQAA